MSSIVSMIVKEVLKFYILPNVDYYFLVYLVKMSESEQSDHNDCGPVDYGQHRYWDERYKKSEGKRF